MYMDCKCPTLAVNIVSSLRLTGDQKYCVRGNFPAFSLSLCKIQYEPPSRSPVCPPGQRNGHVTENYELSMPPFSVWLRTLTVRLGERLTGGGALNCCWLTLLLLFIFCCFIVIPLLVNLHIWFVLFKPISLIWFVLLSCSWNKKLFGS